jgi:nicotinamidase-related amidase
MVGRRRKGWKMIAALIVDMQNAFFEDPAMREQQDQLTAACNELSNAVADGDSKALLVRTEHESDRSTWSLNMLDNGQGFIYRGSPWQNRAMVQLPLFSCRRRMLDTRPGQA